MKKIELKSLKIRNFKGIKELDVSFNQKTNIYGANEVGKTTVFDAFTWLLFGKDSFDRKDFSIKNTVFPELNRQEHEVEGVILINNEEVNIKRIYKEKWQKPKGTTRAVLTGNEQEFYWNDVPFQAGQFASKVNEIMDEIIFKLITNALYFNSLNWKERRELLFQMAGEISDADVAATNSKFNNIIEIISQKTIKGYKDELSVKKKKLKEDLEKIPTRIDELSKSLPLPRDFKLIEKDINKIENQIADIDIILSDNSKATDAISEKKQALQRELHVLKTQIQNLEFSIESEHKKVQNARSNQKYDLTNKIEEIKRNINSKSILLQSQSDKMSGLDLRRNNLRTLFEVTNSKEIELEDGFDSCPTCKRALQDSDIAAKKNEMIKNFMTDKNLALDSIETKGIALKEEIEECEKMIALLEKNIAALETDLNAANENLNDFVNANKLDDNSQEITEIINNNQEIKNLKDKALNIQDDILRASENHNDTNTAEYLKSKSELKQLLDELKREYSLKDQIEKGELRIKELSDQESSFADQLANLESMENEIQEFTKAKIEMVEKRINGKFQFVKFKMYDYTIDGNPIETCETMYKGVPFKDLNTAHKIWAGIDIINTLSDHHQVYAPIFLDNRESVTNIPATDSQIVNLIVSPNDKSLRVA